MEEKFKITFSGMDATEPLRRYALEKFTKHQHLVDHIINADVVMTQHVTHRGVSKDFEITINVAVPKGMIHVQERGEDMYALIDTSSDILSRRLKRYHEKLSQWEGERPWKTIELQKEEDYQIEGDVSNYADYVPTIVERKTMEYMSPMAEAEAIERMELSDRDQILFKNIASGKYCMIYKRRRGGYAIVEPEDQ